VSDPLEVVTAYLEGWKVEDPADCARLLLEALSFMGFPLRSVPVSVGEPADTHCGICGAVKGEDCRNVSPKSPPLNRRFHTERVQAFMHKARNG
jgi:hypothetical protein